jgi:N-methylhydantoinase A
MSAIGFLIAPTSFERVRSFASPLEEADCTRINGLLEEMEAECRAHVRSAGLTSDTIEVTREAAVRYAGQSFDIHVPVSDGRVDAHVIAEIGRSFLKLYQERYHRTNPHVPLEIVSWRVLARGPKPVLAGKGFRASDIRGAALKGERKVYMPEAGDMTDCHVYTRSLLAPGSRIIGPAIVEEDESTAVIGYNGVAEIDSAGNLIVTIGAANERTTSAGNTTFSEAVS